MSERGGAIVDESDLIAPRVLELAHAARIGVACIFVGDPAEYAYLSEAVVEILGWPRSEILKRGPMTFAAPEERANVRARVARRDEGGAVPDTFETVIAQQDGKRVPIRLTTRAVTIAERPALLSLIVDISKRRAAELALDAHEQRFRMLIEAAPDGVVVSRDGVVLWGNAAATRLLGYRMPTELVGLHMGTFLSADDAVAMMERIAEARRGGPLTPRQYRARRQDGSFVTAEITSLPIEWEGTPAVIGFARDVTERQRLEAHLARADRLAALGTLAAGVAHEINNPLAFASLGLERLESFLETSITDATARAEALALVAEIRGGTDRVATIARDLKTFSREKDDGSATATIAEVLAASERLVAHELRQRAQLVVEAPALPPVRGSVRRLEQVFVNLLLNASQTFDAPSPSNVVSVRAHEDEEWVHVDVSDNGPGIAEADVSKIFEPFFTTKTIGGTGLGLSVCHAIVSALGGELTVTESKPHERTTFRVSLRRGEPRTRISALPEQGDKKAGEGRLAILVIDDEPTLARSIQSLLGLDHDVVVETSGAAGLARVLAEPRFDVVLCDLTMPEVTGADVFEGVRTGLAGYERRLVFMTGGAFTPATRDFLERVPNRRIEKPFRVRELEQALMAVAARLGPV